MRFFISLILLLVLMPVLSQPSPFEMAMQAGDEADAKGQLTLALQQYKKAVAEAEATPDRPEWLIRSLLKYGDFMERAGNEGRSEQAAAILARALAVAEKAYGKDDPRVIEPMTALGWQLWRVKKMPEAEARLTGALAIAEKALPADSTKLADARFALGGFYLGQKPCDKAIALYLQALPVYEKAYGLEHQRTQRVHLNLGKCLLASERYEEAETHLRTVVDVVAATKPKSWQLTEALNELSSVYRAQKAYDKAEPLELQLFAVAEGLTSAHKTSLVYYLNRMATFYQDAGTPEKSEPYLQRVIALLKGETQYSRTQLASAYERYAEVLVTLKRADEAAQQYLAAYQTFERWLAGITREHADTGEMMIPQFFHDEVPAYTKFLTRYAAFLRGQRKDADANRIANHVVTVEMLLRQSKAIYERK